MSTIPSEGTILDRDTDTSITVLTEYYLCVKSIELKINDENIEANNFGKTIKIQFGSGTIEGIIGQDFTKRYMGGTPYLIYHSPSLKDMREEDYWDLAKQKKIGYFSEEELIFDYIEQSKYIDGKIWIDNKLINEPRFEYTYGDSRIICEF